MARGGQHSFMKRQKEINRQEKAQEKMAHRQGKKKQATDIDKEKVAGRSEEQEKDEAK